MTETDKMLAEVNSAVRNTLEEYADREIARLTKLFQDRMLHEKDEVLGRFMQSIRVTAERNALNASFDIRIRFSGGAEDDR